MTATLSRRQFLGSFAALPLLALERAEPGTILYNANVLTVDSRSPRAQAVAIAGDRFLAVGTNDELLALATGRTQKINLEGKTVVPGFIDAHCHPAASGRQHLRMVDCDLRSIREIQSAIRQRAEKTPAGQWISGFKFDDTKLSDGRALTRDDLDVAAPGHPVFISHRGGHTAYVNSLAFRLAGIDEKSPDPLGGRFERGPATRRHFDFAQCPERQVEGLTGRVAEEAATAVFTRLIPSTITRDDYREGVKLISQMMSRTGITSVHDADGTHEDLRAYQDAYRAGELSLRVYCLIGAHELDRMLAAGVQTGLGDEWVRVGAVKLYCDGSISERTARLSEPYIGRPADYGLLVTSEEELYDRARKAHLADWQIGIHANGDIAIDQVLRVYERLLREHPRRDPRFRIEHCTVVNDSLISRIRALGVIPTPFSTYVYYHGEKMREYGPERLDRMFALRSMLDAGIRPTQASDYTAGPFEPMMALQSEVTRTDAQGHVWGPRQRITVEEALRVGTMNGAYASFEEGLKGSIEPGKLADLVVLGEDPIRVDPFSLVNVPVERTMVGGRWVFEA